MNRLEYLLLRLDHNLIADPDLNLVLKILKDKNKEIAELKESLANASRESENKSGTNITSGENNNTEPKRPKTKGLRERLQSWAGGTNPENKSNV
jgi:hypothetical protein